MNNTISSRIWPTRIMIVALLAIAVALVSQYGFNMQPCPWCVLQRLLFLVIALVCAIGLVWRASASRFVLGGLVLILSLLGAASAIWQHFVAARSTSCRRTLADRIITDYSHLDQLLPSVFAPRATCADAAVNFLGLPYAFWSLALFVAFALATLKYMMSPAQPAK